MPLPSKKARNLMGMALSVKRGSTPLKAVPAGVRSAVGRIARSTREDELSALARKPRTKALMR